MQVGAEYLQFAYNYLDVKRLNALRLNMQCIL